MLKKQLKALKEKREKLIKKYNNNPENKEIKFELKRINRIIMRQERREG